MISRIYLVALFTCMASLVLGAPGKKNFDRECQKFGMGAYFDPKMLLGPQWRIYYTWNNPMKKTNCMAMKFFNVNPWLVHRFYRDMRPYLQKQPLWSAPILYMTIGAVKDQVLFFKDNTGPEGRVHGVLNLIRHPDITKFKKSLPLLKMQMKLLQGGQYLAIMECLRGTVTLSTRYTDEPPHISEVESVAKKLALGNGVLSCNILKNTTETSLIPPPNYDMD